MDELWTWGISTDQTRWYVKVEDLDTGKCAMAYYSSDDSDPMRWYQTIDTDLLKRILDIETDEFFFNAREQKNMILDLNKLKDATVDNFM